MRLWSVDDALPLAPFLRLRLPRATWTGNTLGGQDLLVQFNIRATDEPSRTNRRLTFATYLLIGWLEWPKLASELELRETGCLSCTSLWFPDSEEAYSQSFREAIRSMDYKNEAFSSLTTKIGSSLSVVNGRSSPLASCLCA